MKKCKNCGCKKYCFVIWILNVCILVAITICCLCGICKLLDISKVLGISSSCIQAFTNAIIAIVGIIAFCYSKMEYESHIEREKAATLANYNERYATDANIQKVVNYLLWKGDNTLTEPANIVHYSNSETMIKPTKNEVEMFMRFFEELQVNIEAGRLDLDKVRDLFAYYAHELPKIERELLPKDYKIFEYQEKHASDDAWHYFNEFIKQTKLQENN